MICKSRYKFNDKKAFLSVINFCCNMVAMNTKALTDKNVPLMLFPVFSNIKCDDHPRSHLNKQINICLITRIVQNLIKY